MVKLQGLPSGRYLALSVILGGRRLVASQAESDGQTSLDMFVIIVVGCPSGTATSVLISVI